MSSDYSVLEQTIIDMVSSYPYYANLISLMDKKLTNAVPVAAVSITTRINLYINPKTFNFLPPDVRTGVLIHECKHLLHNHIGRSKSVAKSFNKALNIAADRAINEDLHYLTKNGRVIASIPDSIKLTPKMAEAFPKNADGSLMTEMKPVTKKNFQTMFKDKKVLNNMDMEYYYKFLKENAEKGENGENDFEGDMDTIDDHSTWEEGESSEEVVKQITKHALNKAAEKTAAGNIPGDVQQALDALNKSVVNWKNELRRFVAHCTNTVIDSTRKKRSRRYGILQPGVVKRPILKLGIAIDTSGSVADKYLNQFFSEINKIHSLGIEVFVVEADTQVQRAFKYNPKTPIVVKGRGGTAFQPAITHLQDEVEVDAIIYFTDGENYCEELKIKKPILWALCPSYTIPKGAKEKETIKITLPEEK